MMVVNKKVYNIAGFPRAGNTLLGSLLNQHPKVMATAHSPIPDMMYQLEGARLAGTFQNFPDQKSFDSVLSNIILNYYKDWDADFIIERGDWITPFNFEQLQKYAPNEIKIVVLVRDILDIIKSFIDVCKENPFFHINMEYNQINKNSLYTDEIETKCDMIMQKESYVDKVLYSLKWLINSGNMSNIKIVEYDDLVNNTQETMQDINNFYGLPEFKYKLKNFEQFKVNGMQYHDEYLQAPLHQLKTDQIKEVESDTVLPESVVRKYSGLEFWRKLKTSSYKKMELLCN